MIVSKLAYLLSRSSGPVCSLSVDENTTVGGVVDNFISNGRHRYEFNSEGTGCRSWTNDQVLLLQQLNVITDEEEVKVVRETMLLKYPKETPYPMDAGAYY